MKAVENIQPHKSHLIFILNNFYYGVNLDNKIGKIWPATLKRLPTPTINDHRKYKYF